ncbi:MAG: hypothetical protein Q9166_002816 [cf. Caloplaca sp. 2 TL-2023]
MEPLSPELPTPHAEEATKEPTSVSESTRQRASSISLQSSSQDPPPSVNKPPGVESQWVTRGPYIDQFGLEHPPPPDNLFEGLNVNGNTGRRVYLKEELERLPFHHDPETYWPGDNAYLSTAAIDATIAVERIKNEIIQKSESDSVNREAEYRHYHDVGVFARASCMMKRDPKSRGRSEEDRMEDLLKQYGFDKMKPPTRKKPDTASAEPPLAELLTSIQHIPSLTILNEVFPGSAPLGTTISASLAHPHLSARKLQHSSFKPFHIHYFNLKMTTMNAHTVDHTSLPTGAYMSHRLDLLPFHEPCIQQDLADLEFRHDQLSQLAQQRANDIQELVGEIAAAQQAIDGIDSDGTDDQEMDDDSDYDRMDEDSGKDDDEDDDVVMTGDFVILGSAPVSSSNAIDVSGSSVPAVATTTANTIHQPTPVHRPTTVTPASNNIFNRGLPSPPPSPVPASNAIFNFGLPTPPPSPPPPAGPPPPPPPPPPSSGSGSGSQQPGLRLRDQILELLQAPQAESSDVKWVLDQILGPIEAPRVDAFDLEEVKARVEQLLESIAKGELEEEEEEEEQAPEDAPEEGKTRREEDGNEDEDMDMLNDTAIEDHVVSTIPTFGTRARDYYLWL